MKTRMIGSGLLILLLFAAITLTGCESALGPTADTANLNTGKAADRAVMELVTITGPLAVIDGKPAVLYQGSPWYVTGLANPDLAEGSSLTITGEAAPILDQDDEGNSLFYGYYLQAEEVTVN